MGLGNSEDVIFYDGDGGHCVGGGKSFTASSVSCSICLEVVADNGDRSWSKLQCGHQFHLDCIGSAFNIKGSMQCPNCRKIEKGQWLYSNGCRSFPEFSVDDWNHDDLYDINYSEMSFGVHWCPYQLGRLPASFGEREFPSTAYHDLLGQHAVFTEHTGASSATHPCPYVTYSGPIHPSFSTTSGTASDGSNFVGSLNGPSLPSDVQNSYAFPAMDVNYHSWEHPSPPFSMSSNRVGGPDQPLVPPVAQRLSRLSEMPRSGSYMHPILVGHSSPAARAGSSVASSIIPPYPGSNARAHDRVQALQAYYHLQPSNSSALRTPLAPSTRRSSSHRGSTPMAPVASSSHQTGSFYFFPSGTTGRSHQESENPLLTRFHARERDHLPAFQSNQMDRELVWGAHNQSASGSNSSIRSGSSCQRQGPERTLS